MSEKAVVSDLSDIFRDNVEQNSWIGKRLQQSLRSTERTEAPPFPRQIQIETTNICNHSCGFCAYTLMSRPKKHMEPALFFRVVKEAYDLGAREIGMFAGAEPLTCKHLEEFTVFARDTGYEYIYMSTNGALADEERFRRLLDAGFSSIKFSINGGNRETYRRIHGRDDFDKVLRNLKFVGEYRRRLPRKIFLGVSFVGMDDSRHTFDELKAAVDEIVDEIIYYEASNQSGQMPNLPLPPYRDCHLPFGKAHVSREGYLKVCCNDYDNLLAVEDLNRTSLAEAWHSPRFQELRRRHVENRLEGTLCANCIRGSCAQAAPLNDSLASGVGIVPLTLPVPAPIRRDAA
jgi:sulfatase maturation enzyme AslB (radical SAM superfamily)